jgi:hypothetical protein
MSRVKPLTSYFKKLSKDEIEIQSLKQTHSREEVAEDEEEEVVVVLPKKKRQKRTHQEPTVANVSRSGRAVHPSTLHGTIQPNRYSTVQ